jgi:hypothetical protein
MGLIQIAWENMEKAHIISLKETYVAISLEDVARKIYGPKLNGGPLHDSVFRIEKLILEMVPLFFWRVLMGRLTMNN